MDPLTLAGGILSLLEVSSSVVKVFRDIVSYDRSLTRELQELQATVNLLEIVKGYLPTDEEIPGIEICLRLCADSLLEVRVLTDSISRKKGKAVEKMLIGPIMPKLREKAKKFISSVDLLRTFFHELRDTLFSSVRAKAVDTDRVSMSFLINTVRELKTRSKYHSDDQALLLQYLEDTKVSF